jgi:excisionase family DNA binding protein
LLMARALTSTIRTAELVDAHPETLRRLYRDGRIPGYKVGRLLRFDVDEVRDALRGSSATPRASARVEPDFGAV